MKHLIITLLALFSTSFGKAIGQAITNYALSSEGNNTLKVGSVFNINGSGPVIQDNSSVSLFVPVDLVTPVITNLQGGSWSATVIANSVLTSQCGAAANGYYLVQISTGGQSNLGGVAAGVQEDLFLVSFTGTSSLSINAFDPNAGDPLSACVSILGVDNTASIDPDGNGGPAMTTGYSNIPILPNSVSLPIELTSFYARPLNATDAKLDWETASELNSSHFEVERSTDGKNWQQVGKVAAAGFSQQNHSYSLIDEKVFEPGESSLSVFYYRLKMLDLDGSFTYSKVREVHFDRAGGLVVGELFPNPAERGHVAFQLPLYTEQEASLRLTVFDVRGSVVGLFETDLAAGEQLAGFDLGQLAAGVYHIRVLVNGETFARRLVVQ
ncbi:MAG: T9SS type A sorting domain-containing protein [Lewinellaceae bacterium]|nr:T9SS type A sorting domain-containing protein [Saprospiraceae bacterium]MCB9336648.1 T9SS type A sorting domain-containing protein [Lewinellaceae bacterium]